MERQGNNAFLDLRLDRPAQMASGSVAGEWAWSSIAGNRGYEVMAELVKLYQRRY